MLSLADQIDETLRHHDFHRISELPTLDDAALGAVRGLWKRKTWNSNRGAALVELESLPGEPLAAVAARLAGPVGRAIGYIPLLHPLGLQLIIAGHGILAGAGELKQALDLADTQTVVLQSLHVVDLDTRSSRSFRTWGQYVTARYQDAIEAGIRQYLHAPAAV
jgi:hypothetical protein